MICEKCSSIHDGTYGSGRFCSKACANSRIRTTETKRKISNKLKKPPLPQIYCQQCNHVFFPKKKTTKFCSRLCARRNNIKLAIQSQVDNPPNWSEIHRHAYRNGNNFISGGNARWLSYKDIKVQGSYELRMCYILDAMLEAGDIKEWEYTNDKILYKDKDQITRSYLFDFKVIQNDETFYYIETKGYEKENDLYKWKSAKQQGISLVVAFDKDIKILERKYALLV